MPPKKAVRKLGEKQNDISEVQSQACEKPKKEVTGHQATTPIEKNGFLTDSHFGVPGKGKPEITTEHCFIAGV